VLLVLRVEAFVLGETVGLVMLAVSVLERRRRVQALLSKAARVKRVVCSLAVRMEGREGVSSGVSTKR
jgi:hypothetical protein